MKLIQIGAIWCASCIVMKTIVNDVLKENPDITSSHLDYDNQKEEYAKYEVGNLLPVMIFEDENGNILQKKVTGNSSKS